MKPTVFFVHSAGPQGRHEGSDDFVAWLTSELGEAYAFEHPAMPHPDSPDYELWKKQLDVEFQHLSGEVILIGHSLGGSVLMKYLATNLVNVTIKSLHLCATPYWGLEGWQYEPFHLPQDYVAQLPAIGSVHIYHSKDDPEVSFEHAVRYQAELPHSELHAIDGDSHVFDEGIKQLINNIKQL